MSDMPILPDVAEVNKFQGLAAEQRKEKREDALARAELQGLTQPATILNLSPFVLKLPSGGLIQFEVPACPVGKEFYAYTVPAKRTLTFPIYTGNQEMSDKSLRARFDVKTLLPIEQLMEFKRAYFADGGMEGLRQGGIVVFEGEAQNLNPKRIVRVPDWMYRKKNRYLVFNERPLGELIEEAREQLKQKTMSVISQCDIWKDEGGPSAKNIQTPHRLYADFALRMHWIDKAPLWRNARVDAADQCPRCGDQYRSKTGVCKCSYVVHPLLAYMAGEITVDHVRLQTLSKEEWTKVKAEQKRRDDARAA